MFVADAAYPEILKLAAARYQPDLFAKGSLSHGYVVIADSSVLLYLHTM